MRRVFWCLLALAAWPVCATAQDPALVEALAPLLQVEDRRELDITTLQRGLDHPDPAVRRAAILAVGRIGQPDGLALLLPHLNDREPALIGEAIFAIGLLRDRTAVRALLDRLRSPDPMPLEAAAEAAVALARIGGPEALTAITEVLNRSGGIPTDRRDAMRSPALLESWRFARQAPVDALRRYASDPDVDIRWRALYALGRAQAPGAGVDLLQAVRDAEPLVRETAVRALTKRYAEQAGLSSDGVVRELLRALDDEAIGVRVNALGALQTFADSTTTDRVELRLSDDDRNVRVAAVGVLGTASGTAATAALHRVLDTKEQGWAVRRAAILALARRDPAGFATRVAEWGQSSEPLDRLVAVQGWGAARSEAAGPALAILTRDADARVRAAAIGAYVTAAPEVGVDAARLAMQDPDLSVRAAAIRAIGAKATDADLDAFAAACASGARDLCEAVYSALGSLERATPGVVNRLLAPSRRGLLDRPKDELLARQVGSALPALGEQWGPPLPYQTGRSLEDYRAIVRGILLSRDPIRVIVDVEQRGQIELELLGRDAPMTVANFLRLVDRQYFDNARWHRVVPNFVVQDGDPTGTGEGGPGWAIRDEINRRRYDVPMLGMALSGPDTGGSQWFINLSPQPHLDGGYTIFGRVSGSYVALKRILQGDRIRTIRRAGRG
jgi:cyclophilin family peptidyl-prolyl cis-trans isomerase/HEAT repeat protein